MPPQSFPAEILLVENSPNDAYFALHAIDACGLPMSQVVVCAEGETAMDYLQATGRYAGREAGNPKLILLDLKLLGAMSGTELLERLRAQPDLHDIPVVVLTGSSNEQDMRCAEQLGIFAYLRKPAGLEETMSALKPCLAELLKRFPGRE